MCRIFIAFTICAFILTIGCSEDENGNPVTPNRPSYDTTLYSLIPAGTFWMGDITGNGGWSSEKPVHEVTITRPFLIGRTEVTQAQYEAVMGNNPSYFTGGDRPVEKVDWYDAVAFCNKLSKQEGLDTCYSGSGKSTACNFTAKGYRLPTEAEWEYACRGGTETDFYTGNLTSSENAPDPLMDLAGWYNGNSNSTTHPVRLREPSSFGLYDMHGNVLELCWDWWGEYYYSSSPSEDPRGPDNGPYRILRGGSWVNNAGHCRSATRGQHNPGFWYRITGFRVVRTY